jgi:hypothetical protein
MSGSLNDVLPEPVSAENEAFIEDLIKHKLSTACSITVELFNLMESHFGPEVRDVFKKFIEDRTYPKRADTGSAVDDLHKFCNELDKGCVGTHKWERIVDEPSRIGYRYTFCVWADIFNELGAPNLGYLLCAGDEPAVTAYNPDLGFHRTKVLMYGDDYCDHIFFVKGQ